MPRTAAFLLVSAFAAGCTVGPDYVRPTAVAPEAYKENANWKVAEPQDHVSRGKWWEIFGDPQLSALIEQVEISNQNVLVAEANFRQARALVRAARSAYFPIVTAGASVTRSRQSGTLGSRPVAQGTITDYALPIDVSWEIDIWGKLRRTLEANAANA